MNWFLEAVNTDREVEDWAASGALSLTGHADMEPASTPGAPASVMKAALARIAASAPDADLPGVEILGERAAIAGLSRRAPWSAGGAFRALRTSDGWLGLSLPRDSDLELVPALIEGPASDPWLAVAAWAQTTSTAAAAARIALLGLAGSPIPQEPIGPRRSPVVIEPGGMAHGRERPLVVDLTSLWAGPLCARLLSTTGARVIKVEHSGRLDGARQGPERFYDLLHAGHESVVLDFRSEDGIRGLRSLLDAADVVLEASRPRALRQLGVHAENYVAQGAVWLSITAYGRGPEEGLRIGFGDDVAAGAGLVGWQRGEPCPAGDALADPLSGAVGAAAVITALDERRGCLLDLSMHDLAAWTACLSTPKK